MVITYDNRYAYSEIVEILGNLDVYYVEKLPIRLREFFTYNKLPDYIRHINIGQPLSSQNLSQKTVTILAILNLRYWVENDDKKKELVNEYKRNEEECEERYSSDNLFKKSVESQVSENVHKTEEIKENSLIEIKQENIFKRFWNFIRRKFKK